MRKTLLLVAGCALAATASAQIVRGTLMAGGSFAVNTQENEGDPGPNFVKSKALSFLPSVGLFVRDNLAVGVRGGYGGSTQQFENGKQQSRNASADFFVRKYLPLGKGFYLFGEASAGYFRNKMESKDGGGRATNAITTNGFSIAAYPGISYAVSRRLQLETGLNNLLNIGYSSSKYTNTTTPTANITRSSNFDAGIGPGGNIPLNMGVRLFLGK